MRILEKINITQDKTINSVDKQRLIKRNNDYYLRKAQYISHFFNYERDLTTEFEPVDSVVNGEDIDILYKQWDVEVFLNKTGGLLENELDVILPFINYEIIYKDPETNNINYYNSDDDLQTTFFYEVREDLLILHVSLHIARGYNGSELFIPEAKLRVSLRNPLKINN